MNQQAASGSKQRSAAFLPHPGRWWAATAILLVVCVAILLWFGRMVLIPLQVVDPGESWTDQWGTTYTVVSRQRLDRLGDQAPREGAVFLRYVVQIDNYSINQQVGESSGLLDVDAVPDSTSSFELMGDQGQYWTRTRIGPQAGEQNMADWTERPLLRSQQIVACFEVPIDQVDHVMGLVERGDRRTTHRFPIMR